jgi:hypothetical protein
MGYPVAYRRAAQFLIACNDMTETVIARRHPEDADVAQFGRIAEMDVLYVHPEGEGH